MKQDSLEHDPVPDGDAGELLRLFLTRLIQQYSALGEAAGGSALSAEVVEARLSSLALAEAVVRGVRGGAAGRPRQIAVIGPTQVGKSTVVNLLLGSRVAEVSPLAGFTVHPHGFALDLDGDDGWLAPLFPGWRRCQVEELSRERLDRYAVVGLSRPPVEGALAAGTVVWDTPDFDSLAAGRYRRGLLEVVALADAVVLVLSREKYSDLSVWETLRLIEPLGRPLLVCLNKMTLEAEETIIASLRRRLAEWYSRHGTVKVVTLPQQPGIDAISPEALPPTVARLREDVRVLAEGLDPAERMAGAHRFLDRHWSEWTEPVVIEHTAVSEWYDHLERMMEEALSAYRRDYLDHPQRFDTFRRAVAKLLYLLELPGVAGTLSRVRHLLTWPARRLFGARSALSSSRRQGKARAKVGEVAVLGQVFDQLLTTLAREAARRCDASVPAAAFWRALSNRLAESRGELVESFAAAARHHHDAFEPEIESAAGRLYEELQRSPALLNTLRATRVTTDAAAIAVAVKTAGLGMGDLLVAPAMLSLTSSLTEGALGTYMSQVAKELKERQYAAVEDGLFHEVVRPALEEIVAGLDGPGIFAISGDELAAAEQAREGLSGG